MKAEPEVLKADKGFRLRLFAGYGLALVALPILVPIAARAFHGYFVRAEIPQKLLAAEVAGSGFLILFILPAVYLVITGRRAIRESRWPPSGMKVIQDTVLQRGPMAVARGRRLAWLGAICIVFVVLGSLATRFIFHKVKTDPFFFVRKQSLEA